MHDVPQPMLYIKNDWKNIDKHQAKQTFQEHMNKQCRENPDIGYHCEEKTANSFVPVYKNIMSSGTSSMFCIPLNRDMNGMAEKYVNEEIEIYSGAKTLFPFDE